MPEKPAQPGMTLNKAGDAVHFDLVLATGRRTAPVVVAPCSPAVHQPLRIGPGALVEANLVHIRQQPLGAPAQHSLLHLHGEKCGQHQGQNDSTCKEDNAYSPLSQGHI
jgi:hypothetical protein